MKNLLPILFLSFGLFQTAQAQSQSAFHVFPNPADTIAPLDSYDNPADGEIKNISNDTIKVKWERQIIMLTADVTTAVCDPVNCWFPGIGTKIFQLAPNEMGQLIVHFYNNAYDPAPGQAGSGIVHLKLTNLNDLTDTLTAVYTYSTLTGIKDLPAANVKLFPNPTADFFTLENATDVAYIRMYTLDGRQAAAFTASAENSYSIANQMI